MSRIRLKDLFSQVSQAFKSFFVKSLIINEGCFVKKTLLLATDVAGQYNVFNIVLIQFQIQYIAFGIVPNNNQYNNFSNKQLEPTCGIIFSEFFFLPKH